jgi:protein involved in polysaccharide export with SLBB domain
VGGAGSLVGSLEGTVDPDAYLLGAGDILTIGFWGDVNRVENVTVNPDGNILLAPVGPVAVDGLSLSEVRELVKSKLAAYYKPSILSVSLVSIRTFQAHVVGMVVTPGAVEVNGVTRVSQAIGMADGFRPGGARRNIRIRRGDSTLRADLTRYMRLGDNDMNPYLRDGDVVVVPVSPGMVEVFGSVFLEGPYEYVDGENLEDMLELAGGLRPEAYTESIEVERFDEIDPTRSRPISVKGEPDSLRNVMLRPGDRIFVRAIPDWHRDASVTVNGEVKYPGVYAIEEGVETLTKLIDRAGGLTAHASLAEATLVRGLYFGRPHPVERELPVLLELDNSRDPKDTDLLKAMSRETKGAEVISFGDVFLSEGEESDYPLVDGDVINIPRASGFIRVSGQVAAPGLVPIKEGADYRYYIRAVGGYASKADQRGTVLIRGTGGQRVKPGSLEVLQGDIIWVPKRPDYSWWGITKDILTVAAQVATVWLVVDSITRD